MDFFGIGPLELLLILVILIVVVVSALIGLSRGLFKEVLSLASWFAAFILALYFSSTLKDHLSYELGDESVRMVIAFGLMIGSIRLYFL